ncbi:hypothetical protein HEHE104102_07995 [Helicobacter hepaticus]|jgi:uncharacterized membrane protein YhdT|uniref:Uncharacterized protein n=1 Tax=Helicobacter hepaticus (strain ATCC 51449 / 3B1) TaxID=235279 RepID=Q7VH66_HELHP|nr:hypothetical protein HH_1101 [Helicobacter hepaticus ATCC 51449]
MLTSIFMLILWIGIIYVCYKFIVFNITHLENQESK